MTFQKEVLDLFGEVTFIGVVDALGRQHGLTTKDSRELLEESWRLPTRVGQYIKRETKRVSMLTYVLLQSLKAPDAEGGGKRRVRGTRLPGPTFSPAPALG